VKNLIFHVEEEREGEGFENMALRRIFESKKVAVTGECRRMYNEEFYDLYSSRNIIWSMKSRTLR